jgi:hypothetical protein
MAMTAREATRRDSTRRTQSVAFEVRYPTSQLTLKVIMPPGFEPSDARPVVWYGQARVPHEAELFHLRSHDSQGFAATPNVDFERRMEMTLVVDYPLMGLTYGVEWVPPDDWR